MTNMKLENIFAELTKIFRETLDDESIELTKETTALDIDGWDSLTNISILVNIEGVFDISFSTAEIADIPNIGELAELILARL